MPKAYINEDGYDTDRLIRGMTDYELMQHMGIPRRCLLKAEESYLAGKMRDEVEVWFDNMARIFRPDDDHLSENWPGKGLILHGPSTRGKTMLACAILLRAVRMGVINRDPTGKNWSWHGWAMGLFVDWQEVSELLRLSAGGDEEAGLQVTDFMMLMRPEGDVLYQGDFLVIDDVSRERATQFNANELHRVLRRRENNGYPTILTTNHDPNEWEDVYGGPMAGLLGRAYIPVEF